MEEAAELRALARVGRDPGKRVRLLALANVRDGMPVDEAARATGMGRATLSRWLARERTGGPAALKDRPRAGRRRKPDAAQRAEVRAWIVAGPDVERDGVVAWRGGDVRALVERRFKVKRALSSAYRLLDELHLSALVPRPRHGDADPAAQAAFQRTAPHGQGRAAPVCRPAPRSRSGAGTRCASGRRAP
jgi:putative transposase